MVSASAQYSGVGLCERGAAEFAGEQDHGVIEQTCASEVGQEGGQGLVHTSGLTTVILDHVLVSIPVVSWTTESAATEELHEADTLLEQSSCQQARAAEVCGGFASEAVELLRGLGFGIESCDLRDSQLHAGRQLVTADSPQQRIVGASLFEMLSIQ